MLGSSYIKPKKKPAMPDGRWFFSIRISVSLVLCLFRFEILKSTSPNNKLADSPVLVPLIDPGDEGHSDDDDDDCR